MATKERNTKLSAVEAVAGDRDLVKGLMKEALQEVLAGEMTRVSGDGAGRVHGIEKRLSGRLLRP